MTRVPSHSDRLDVRRQFLTTVLIALVTASLGACDRPRLDEDLCPMGSGLARKTILLVDASDPLSAKHREVLRRMVAEMQGGNAAGDLTVRPGEALVVYKLEQSVDTVEPVLRVCNPGGNPEDWTWQDSLTQGQAIALRHWRKFLESVEPLFPEDQGNPQAQSLILETLGVVVPRHAPSRRRMGDPNDTPVRTHLIIYSDLLQHSPALSHYGLYPPADSIKSTVGMRHLHTDLTGVDVSLYRLERERDARWQTVDHYYWWTEIIGDFGGELIWQEPI